MRKPSTNSMLIPHKLSNANGLNHTCLDGSKPVPKPFRKMDRSHGLQSDSDKRRDDANLNDWLDALDPRISCDTHWLLKVLSNFPKGVRPSVDTLLSLYNRFRSKRARLGVERLRRMTGELREVGYLRIEVAHRPNGRGFDGKIWILTLPGASPVIVGADS